MDAWLNALLKPKYGNGRSLISIMKKKIVIIGSKGRMGKTLLACVPNHQDIEVVGQVDIGDDIDAVIEQANVVVDFSVHTATLGLLEHCVVARKATVIGTTGHSEDELHHIGECASHIPIVKATNFSTGVNTLFWLTRKAAEILGPSFDVEIVEMHHRLKKDAPSGTAVTLGEIITEAYIHGTDMFCYGRKGNTGVRPNCQIGIHAIRGGDVVGDHTVIFAGIGERVELAHKASSRETFANGAFRAAEWVVKQPPGLYSMQDVLGLI